MKLRYVLILIGALLLSGYGWLKQHDKMVSLRAQTEEQAKQLDKAARTTDGLRKAVVALDSAYAAATWDYQKQVALMNRKRVSMEHAIDSLTILVMESLPDSHKHLAPQIATLCKANADQIYSALVVCESLRKQAVEQVAKRDTLNVRLMGERDGYRKLYQTAVDAPKGKLSIVQAGIFTALGIALRSLIPW